VILGTQWGDEGKGKAIDTFAGDFDYVARYNGGNNAGHTILNEHGTFKIHLVPSGIFYPRTRCLIGGGVVPRPGEVSLAHHGVLFLDELPEFPRNVLEVMRQPLEDGTVCIARASMSLTFPARFMLAAAMNPCPCGYFNDRSRECHCTQPMIQRYVAKISGPLLDRIDIHIDVPAVNYKELRSAASPETSAHIRERVVRAREVQLRRFAAARPRTFCNAQMQTGQIRTHCELSPECERLLERAINQQGLSARAHDRILKVARTIADLEGAAQLDSKHIAEAIQYRTLDRNYWA
jgi:magnesium chelatase family protein